MSITLPRTSGTPGARLRAHVRRLAEVATHPLVPADFLDLFAPLRPGADLRGRIVSVTPETKDAATLVIKPGADWAGHVPGQYLRIGVDVDGVRQWRAYSLTHGPRRDGLISITVKAVPEGLVSTHLVRESKPGTLIHLEQAAGEFVLPTDGGKLLFVTAGSGITPVIGMLRNLFPVTDDGVLRLPRSAAYDIVVLHVAPSAPDSIFADDLHALADAGVDLAGHALRRRARRARPRGAARRWCPTSTRASRSPAARAGSSTRSRPTTPRAGSPLFTEQFRAARVVAGDGGTVTFDQTGLTVEGDGSRPILDIAEDAGQLMPSGCRMGICYGCVLPLKEGAVRDLRNGQVTTAVAGETNIGGTLVQTCINAPAGACHFDH